MKRNELDKLEDNFIKSLGKETLDVYREKCIRIGIEIGKEETKKWIKGLIKAALKGSSDDSEFALGWEHGLKALEKQISGEGK